MAQTIKRCSLCILTDSFPGITFDESGVCSICREYAIRWRNLDFIKSEEYIKGIFEAVKLKKKKYDCVVGLSGGKDSSYVLYLCTQKYKMKPLCVTFDNGFLSSEAAANIKKLTNKLNVDHIFVKLDWDVLKRLYRHFLMTTGEFCSVCNIGIISSQYDVANKYDIPLIVSGFSPRTDPDLSNSIYHLSTEYFYNVAKGHFSKTDLKEFLHDGTFSTPINHLTGKRRSIALPRYVEWDENKIVAILEKELDWKVTAAITKEHTDCIASEFKEYLRIKEFGFSEKSMKFAMLVMGGFMSREDALNKSKAFEEQNSTDNFGKVLKAMNLIGISEGEVAEAVKKRQAPYIPKYVKLLEKNALINVMKKLYYKI